MGSAYFGESGWLLEIAASNDSVCIPMLIYLWPKKKFVCFRLHEILKWGREVGKSFYFVKSFYMGMMGKHDSRPGKSLGNSKICLKTLVREQKIRHRWVT